ncbi:hypothetical protein F5X97DRAFT_304369 [Nemania serpens]|nr:hypothetical protein F5X97DRAFT_304369 [Nemania serpens]
MADSIRGDGLLKAHGALLQLVQDPLQLERERRRFSRSPPPCVSGTTTISASPSGLTEEQRRRCRTRPLSPDEERYLREKRRQRLWGQIDASRPYKQFQAHVEEEGRRIWNTNPSTREMEMTSAFSGLFSDEAAQIVKNRWVEQGIWNDSWGRYASASWKHEEPLKLEPEEETDSEVGSSPPGLFSTKPQPRLRQPKSDDEKRRIAEQRSARTREREASRPYHQFAYQVSEERERIQQDAENGEGVYTADINTRAYESVKNTWTERGIWNERWGILPGMSWKHEDPPPPECAPSPSPAPASPLAKENHQIVTNTALTTAWLFRSPPLAELNSQQKPGALNTSQQGPPADVDLARSENNHTEGSSHISNSHAADLTKRICRPRTREIPQSSKANTSHKNGQQAAVSLGPINPSKVSKATGKRKRPQRQMARLPLASQVNVVEPQPLALLDNTTPRRSPRLRRPVPSVSEDQAKSAASSRSKRAVRAQPERNTANSATIKRTRTPRAESKKQRVRTKRKNAENNE